jgi:hypothetical protein
MIPPGARPTSVQLPFRMIRARSLEGARFDAIAERRDNRPVPELHCTLDVAPGRGFSINSVSRFRRQGQPFPRVAGRALSTWQSMIPSSISGRALDLWL